MTGLEPTVINILFGLIMAGYAFTGWVYRSLAGMLKALTENHLHTLEKRVKRLERQLPP